MTWIEQTRPVDASLVRRISGIQAPDVQCLHEVTAELTPAILTEQRLLAQAAEVALIAGDATAVERLFKEKGLPLPSAYGILTTGYEVPKEAIQLGKFGEGAFIGFPKPAAVGYAGEAYAVKIGDKTAMFLQGRAHPNEWTGERFGNMIVTHPLRVIQELIRRQRVKDGSNPPVVLTYVTGVAVDHAMKSGDLGIIIDDAEGTNNMHPGQGAVELLDQYVGPHFQAKMGRASDKGLAQLFLTSANELEVTVCPAAAFGTPGTPEYQSHLDAAWGRVIFNKARDFGLNEYAQEIYGVNGPTMLSLLYDMGITFELATLRQTHSGEDNLRVLAIGLATDTVGGTESLTIDHGQVVAQALATGERNTNLIMHFLGKAVNTPAPLQNTADFSLQTKLKAFAS